jgi:hypothetical protein
MHKQARSTNKTAASDLSQKELLSLYGELHRLSRNNQSFLHAHFGDAEAVMAGCKSLIAPDASIPMYSMIARCRLPWRKRSLLISARRLLIQRPMQS